MKTFDEIKNELKRECEEKLDKLSNLNVGTPDYINAMKEEMIGILSNLDERVAERIDNRIQHIIDMANFGKPLEDIIQFNTLGINAQDEVIIKHIHDLRYSQNNSIFEEKLRNAIKEQLGIRNSIEETIENEQNKMRM